MLASDWTQKYFSCPITVEHLNESWNWFVKSSSLTKTKSSSEFQDFLSEVKLTKWLYLY